MGEEDFARLRATPLRELSAAALNRFAFKAMTTWGTADDFRHFLPRIFELLATNQFEPEAVDVEVILSKLAYGEWDQWPTVEKAAILNYLHAIWSFSLNQYPPALDPGSLLCGIGQSVDHLSDFLQAWLPDQSIAMAFHFSDFVEFGSARGLQNAFWKERQPQREQVLSWLADPRRLTEMEEAFFRFADQGVEVSTAISMACESLKAMRAE